MGVAVRREEEGRVRTGFAGCCGVRGIGDRREVWPLMRRAEAEGKSE